jgi:hypothetical protein
LDLTLPVKRTGDCSIVEFRSNLAAVAKALAPFSFGSLQVAGNFIEDAIQLGSDGVNRSLTHPLQASRGDQASQ